MERLGRIVFGIYGHHFYSSRVGINQVATRGRHQNHTDFKTNIIPPRWRTTTPKRETIGALCRLLDIEINIDILLSVGAALTRSTEVALRTMKEGIKQQRADIVLPPEDTTWYLVRNKTQDTKVVLILVWGFAANSHQSSSS